MIFIKENKTCTVVNLNGWKGEKISVCLKTIKEYKSLTNLYNDLFDYVYLKEKSICPSHSSCKIDLRGIDMRPKILKFDIFGLYSIHCSGLYTNIPEKVYDIIDKLENYKKYGEFLPPYIWLSLEIPRDLKKNYDNSFTFINSNKTIKLNVFDIEFPKVQDWKFHLDLWQNPWAVQRVNNLKNKAIFKDENIHFLEDQIKLLYSSGQKAITCTIIEDAWASQTYDKFKSMIEWKISITNSESMFMNENFIKKLGKHRFSWDFTIFEKYVNLWDKISSSLLPIHIFSILPWGTNIGCGNKDGIIKYTFTPVKTLSTKKIVLDIDINSQEYKNLWTWFLEAFISFCDKKNLSQRIYWAFDERHTDDMIIAIDLLKSVLPEELKPPKIANANNYVREIADDITNLSVFYNNSRDWNRLTQNRRNNNQKTTFYLCESPKMPLLNTFLLSDLYYSRMIGWYCFANGFDGFLRWAFDSWNKTPTVNGDYRGPHNNWDAGDTFLSYPTGVSSRRLETLVSGIQDFEKLHILQQKFSVPYMKNFTKNFIYGMVDEKDFYSFVNTLDDMSKVF